MQGVRGSSPLSSTKGSSPSWGGDTTKGACPRDKRSGRMYPVCCGGPLLRAIVSSGRLVFFDAQLRVLRGVWSAPTSACSLAASIADPELVDRVLVLWWAAYARGVPWPGCCDSSRRSLASPSTGVPQFAGPLIAGFRLAQCELFVTFQGLF